MQYVVRDVYIFMFLDFKIEKKSKPGETFGNHHDTL